MSSNSATYIYPNQETNLDWGEVQIPIGKPVSSISGYLLEKNNDHEMGYWECTKGKWECHVTKNEFCHFIEGECEYTSKSGEVIKIVAGTIAFFPKDWKGTCTVNKKIKKFYCIF